MAAGCACGAGCGSQETSIHFLVYWVLVLLAGLPRVASNNSHGFRSDLPIPVVTLDSLQAGRREKGPQAEHAEYKDHSYGYLGGLGP